MLRRQPRGEPIAHDRAIPLHFRFRPMIHRHRILHPKESRPRAARNAKAGRSASSQTRQATNPQSASEGCAPPAKGPTGSIAPSIRPRLADNLSSICFKASPSRIVGAMFGKSCRTAGSSRNQPNARAFVHGPLREAPPDAIGCPRRYHRDTRQSHRFPRARNLRQPAPELCPPGSAHESFRAIGAAGGSSRGRSNSFSLSARRTLKLDIEIASWMSRIKLVFHELAWHHSTILT